MYEGVLGLIHRYTSNNRPEADFLHSSYDESHAATQQSVGRDVSRASWSCRVALGNLHSSTRASEYVGVGVGKFRRFSEMRDF